MDFYQKIADEEGVSRSFVKIHTMALFYCVRPPGWSESIVDQVRQTVRIAKALAENMKGKDDETSGPAEA